MPDVAQGCEVQVTQSWPMYPCVYSSTIHSSQDTETAQMSIDRWMDKGELHIYNEILVRT